MKIFSSIVSCLILVITSSGQPIERHIADSLFSALTKIKPNIERIKILNQLAQFFIFKPGENQIDFDSASVYLKEARQINKFIKSSSLAGQLLLTESYMLREKGHTDSAIFKVEEAITTLEASGDKYFLGKALYELSGYYKYYDNNDLPKKINLVERSVAAFEQSGNMLDKAEALKMLGDLYYNNLENNKALDALNKALAAYTLADHKALQGLYDMLGSVYRERNDYKQALYYQLLAVKTAEVCKDTTIQVCQIKSNLGSLYTRSSSYDKSIQLYQEALKIAIKYNDLHAIALLVFNITTSYSALRQPFNSLNFLSSLPSNLMKPQGLIDSALVALSYMEGYAGTGDYAKAQKYCTILLKLEADRGMPSNLNNLIRRTLGIYYFDRHDYSRARYFISKNERGNYKSSLARSISLDERLRFKIDSAEGHYESAIHHFVASKDISDSLVNVTKTRQLQQLEVEYETAKKEDSLRQQAQNIALLQQRNNLQQSNLKQTNLIKNISIIGTLLILIILILLFYQFRKNQKSNKIILQTNEALKNMLAEKEWWLKEVHHRVKNNLHTIICLLESQAMYLEKDALQAIEKSQHRIYAMSMIHQKLYQNEDVKSIDMSVYLHEFIQYLKDSFDVDGIEFITKVEPIQLNLTQAVPVGLIINEVVTNSIKYAFTDRVGARIFVSMNETAGIVNLTIADNGKGFIPNPEAETKSLGMQLIKGLSKEIRGSLSIAGDNGTKVAIRFKKDIISLTEQFMQKELANYEA